MKSPEYPTASNLKKQQRPFVKIETLLVLDDIKAGLDKGYSLKAIWRQLRKMNRISASYGGFMYMYKKLTNTGNRTDKINVDTAIGYTSHDQSVMETSTVLDEALSILENKQERAM